MHATEAFKDRPQRTVHKCEAIWRDTSFLADLTLLSADMNFFPDAIVDRTATHPVASGITGQPPSLIASLLAKADWKFLGALFIVVYVVQAIYYCWFHQLCQVPGPFLARFSQAWRNIRYFKGTWLRDVTELHEKYGNVVRIAPNEVSFVDRDALRALYGHGKVSQKVSYFNPCLELLGGSKARFCRECANNLADKLVSLLVRLCLVIFQKHLYMSAYSAAPQVD